MPVLSFTHSFVCSDTEWGIWYFMLSANQSTNNYNYEYN